MKLKKLIIGSGLLILCWVNSATGQEDVISEEDQEVIANLEILEHLEMLIEDPDLLETLDILKEDDDENEDAPQD